MWIYAEVSQLCVFCFIIIETIIIDCAGASCSKDVFAYSFARTITSPNWPARYSTNLNCVWTISSHNSDDKIIIEFDDINLACCRDTIRVYDGNILAGLPIRAHAGNEQTTGFPSPYVSTTNVITVRMITYGPRVSTGFRFTYQIENPGPNDKSASADIFLTEPTAILSPNFPNNYNHNIDSLWTITAPIGKQILFNLSELHTESCCDYLQLKDGKDERLLVKLGKKPIKTNVIYRSSTSILKVFFHTDSSINHPGFRGIVSTVPHLPSDKERFACGFTAILSQEKVMFSTPNYPLNYAANLDCNWLLKSPYDGWQVHLVFEDYKTEYCCDFLKIFDGPNSESLVLTSLRGGFNQTKYEFTSSHRYLYLSFFSDHTINYRGFSGHYTLVKSPTPTVTVESNLKESDDDDSMVSEVSCFDGIKLSSDRLMEDLQRLTRCPSGSSCLDLTVNVLADIGGSSTTVQLYFGQCLPSQLCNNFTCDEVFEVLPPSIPSNLHNCTLHCCNEDNCNRPLSLHHGETTYDSAIDDDCHGDDLPFLPGCTMNEMKNHVWLCFTLFFNDYPYSDAVACSNNLQLYQLCMYGVTKKCEVGMKPTLSGQLAFAEIELLASTFINLTTVIHPTIEAFCKGHGNNIGASGGLFDFILVFTSRRSQHCNIRNATNRREEFISSIEDIFNVQNTTDLCRVFSSMTSLAVEIVRSCEVGAVLDLLQINPQDVPKEVLQTLQNIYEKSVEMLSQSFLPQCL